MDENETMMLLYDNFTLAIEENQKKNKTKVDDVKNATWLILCAIISFSIFALFNSAEQRLRGENCLTRRKKPSATRSLL